MLVALSRTQLAGQSVCVASRGHLAGSVGVIRAGFFIIYPLDPPLFQYFSRAREVVWHGFLQFRPQSGILCALFLALLFYPLLPPATSTWALRVAAMCLEVPRVPILGTFQPRRTLPEKPSCMLFNLATSGGHSGVASVQFRPQ